MLTTLVSVNPIYASFDADEQVVARALKDVPGAALARTPRRTSRCRWARRRAARRRHRGHLQLVDNQVNAKSGTVRVRAVFDNKDGSLMPGQFAKLRLGRAKATPALLINERAVGTDQNKKFVMVVGADNKAAYREVTLGASVDGLRIVTAGPQGRRAHRRERPAARAPRRPRRPRNPCRWPTTSPRTEADAGSIP